MPVLNIKPMKAALFCTSLLCRRNNLQFHPKGKALTAKQGLALRSSVGAQRMGRATCWCTAETVPWPLLGVLRHCWDDEHRQQRCKCCTSIVLEEYWRKTIDVSNLWSLMFVSLGPLDTLWCGMQTAVQQARYCCCVQHSGHQARWLSRW